MTKLKKIYIGLAVSAASILAITIPTALYVESVSVNSQANHLENDFNGVYLKELSYSSANNKNVSAQTTYDNLPTTKYSFYQLINGDKTVNHGNYLLLLGDQFDLAYQAIAYANFASNMNIYNFNNNYNSPLYNALNQIGWNIPIFEYVYYPQLNAAKTNNQALTPYYVYETYFLAPNTTIQGKLYENMANYANNQWNLKLNLNESNLVLMSFNNGIGKQCQFKSLNTYLTPSSGSSPINNSPNGIDTTSSGSTTNITYGTYINQSTKQSIASDYSKTLSSFITSSFDTNQDQQNQNQTTSTPQPPAPEISVSINNYENKNF